jgi:hypothetical protein
MTLRSMNSCSNIALLGLVLLHNNIVTHAFITPRSSSVPPAGNGGTSHESDPALHVASSLSYQHHSDMWHTPASIGSVARNMTQSLSFLFQNDPLVVDPPTLAPQPQPQQQQPHKQSFSWMRSSRTQQPQRDWKVYCDLDGVLVDFEHGIRRLFPHESACQSWQLQDISKPYMWQRVQQAHAFFEHLPWTRDGPELWRAIQPLRPDILTGCAPHTSSRTEKFAWCQRELGVDVVHVDMAGYWHTHAPVHEHLSERCEQRCNVVTCWSFNKHYESGPGRVLIDDRWQLRDDWERKGGLFVHHTDLESTLTQLYRHGILKE